jgi:hypothetical protein
MDISRLYRFFSFFMLNLLFISTLSLSGSAAGADDGKNAREGIYYKSDQGITWGVLLDQRMSNLHYGGPGGLINFGRHAYRTSYISEWNFARLMYNYSRPAHKNTVVMNPSAGFRYIYLRKLDTPAGYSVHTGAQANVLWKFPDGNQAW